MAARVEKRMRMKVRKGNDLNYDEADDRMLQMQDEMGVDRSKWLRGDSYS